MADINIDGIVTWLKNWFYDKTEITGFLNNKANQSDLQTTNSNLSTLSSTVDNKVDKVTGKGLSTEDFTTALKDKLDGIEAQANKITVDDALSSTSTNPVQNKVVNTALEGKAPTSHSSSATTYGVGTSSDYGHTKVINNLTTSSHSNGNSLSAYQGKVLKDLIDTKTSFSGSYTDLTDVPSTFTPSAHNQASTTITESSALSNIGTSANANQHTINTAINTVLGNLVDVKFIEITTDKGTATADKMNKLYIETKNSKTDVYYVVRSGTSPNYTYDWEDLDTDILDNLVINWSDVQNKPSTFTPSSHTHGYILNDGSTTTTKSSALEQDAPVIVDTEDNNKIKSGKIATGWIFDVNAYSNIGSSANASQEYINRDIDFALSGKGAKTDDIDWSYNSNGFTNGIKLVDKTTNAYGRIILHLKS